MTHDDFHRAVCNHIFGLFDCSKIYVSVKTFTTFGGITYAPPTLDGQGALDPSRSDYLPGGPGDIVVVQLFYQWPIFVSLMNLSSLSTSGSGHIRLLVATAAFRNEPY